MKHKKSSESDATCPFTGKLCQKDTCIAYIGEGEEAHCQLVGR